MVILLGVVCTDLDALAEKPFAAVLAAVLAATKTKALAAKALALAATFLASRAPNVSLSLPPSLPLPLPGMPLNPCCQGPCPTIMASRAPHVSLCAAANTCPASAGATSCGGGGPPDFAGA